MRKRMLLTAAAGALALAGCQQRGTAEEVQPGPVGSRTFQVATFDRVTAAGPFQVEVRTNGQPSVTAQGPSNLLEKMVVEVDGSELKVRTDRKNGSWRWGGEPIRVTVTGPMIRGATLAGSGGIGVDRVAGDSFEAEIAGSGKLRLPAVEVTNLSVEIAGSGDVEAAGRARAAKYEIAGSGNVRAAGLMADGAEVEIAGSGNVEAGARSTARVEILGAGNVRITGGAKCTVEKRGAGNVTCS